MYLNQYTFADIQESVTADLSMYVSIGVLYQLDNSKDVKFTDAFGRSSVRDESVYCVIPFF